MSLQTHPNLTRRISLVLLPWLFLVTLSTSAEIDKPPQGQLPLQELRTFTDIFDHIRRNYIEEVDDKTLLENAIRGMLAGLDPHSAYLDAESFGDLRMHTTGEFGGLGLEVGMEDGAVRVISPIDDTPAKRAGVESGDLIIKLDEHSVKGMSLGEAIELMRGPTGSDITLTIVREGTNNPFDIVVTRDVIKIMSVKSKLLEPDYGYVRIAQFQSQTGAEMAKAMEKLQSGNQTLKGLIVDLRDNPGGILQSSVDVVDNLLNDGMIVYTQGRLDSSRSAFHARPGDLSNGTPLVVLINGGSASASEIVAGALQDHKRAIIMGTDSFGKGSVQTVMPISEKKAIKLTTALYFTPSGRSIQAQGIQPDIIVDRAKVEKITRAGGITEADLTGHLKNANGNKENGSAKRKNITGSDDLQVQDNQLYEALSLLKGLNILSQHRKITNRQLAVAATSDVL
jgi:carboxyl-terminal processing protease